MKDKIKSIPFLYNGLLPLVMGFRQVRAALLGEPGVERFRRYCSYLPSIVEKPVFVKVGANDGITADPCSDILLSKSSWNGLLIEPVPYCFDRLKVNFHDDLRFALKQIAIGDHEEEATFFSVDPIARESIPNLPPWFDQLGSFEKDHIVKHLDSVLTPFILENKVKVRPLADVLAKYGAQYIHLLHIDTEGHDYEVIKTLNFEEHRPLAIFIEHKHLSDSDKADMLDLLQTQKYSVLDCGSDYFALDKKAYKRLRWAALTRRR